MNTFSAVFSVLSLQVAATYPWTVCTSDFTNSSDGACTDACGNHVGFSSNVACTDACGNYCIDQCLIDACGNVCLDASSELSYLDACGNACADACGNSCIDDCLVGVDACGAASTCLGVEGWPT